jgi:small subunit ribosomal protein S21
LALHRNVALSRRSFYCPNIGDLRRAGASGGPDRFDEQETTRRMQIIVRDNNVDQALRALKKKLQREGVYREMKLRRHYEKPSEKRARERAAAVRRARKMERKRMERDGIK